MVRIRSDQSLEYLERPKYYHYCKISLQNLDNIYNNNLWLSHPIKFNDPFDSKLKITDCKINNTVLKLISKYLINRSNDIDIEDSFSYDSLINYFSSNKNEEAPPFTEAIDFALIGSNDKLNELKNLYYFFTEEGLDSLSIKTFFTVYFNLGVHCFSKSFYSPQMWSYYADDHKGMCIEYDFKKEISNEYNLEKIIYSKNNPELLEVSNLTSETEIFQQILSQICYKSSDWCHEKEVRLITKDLTETLVKNPATITGICLGLRTSDSDIRLIKNLFKNIDHEIDIYKAELNEIYFTIDWKSLPGFLPFNQRSYSEQQAHTSVYSPD